MVRLIFKGLLGICFLLLSTAGYSQSVGIGTDTPDPSAALQISGNGQGLLIPQTDTSLVVSPASGLLVFQTVDAGFYYYSGSEWIAIKTESNDAHDNLGDHLMLMDLNVNDNWITGTNGMGGIYIDKDGFVGINNPMPVFSLDVSGEFRFADGSEAANRVMVTANASGMGTWTDISNIQDNLGDHIATDHLQMSGNWISNDADKEGVFIAETGTVSIGTSALVPSNAPNTLGVAGRLAIGENFIVQGAPTNGLIVEGNVSIGTPNPAINGITLLTSDGTNPVGISQSVYAGGSALEFTTTDDAGKQASRIAIRGTSNDADITFQRGPAGAEVEMVHIEGSNGRVGIGTMAPDRTLDVNGTIRGEFLEITAIAEVDELLVTQEIVFSNKDLYATGTSYVSNIVTGSVNVIGSKVPTNSNTAGYTVTKLGVGRYQVIFPTGSFSEVPVISVTANADGASDNRFAIILAKSSSKFDVGIKTASGAYNDAPFDFIAIGVR